MYMTFHDHCLLSNLFQADVIMALAGSNGGSWSTTYSPKSTVRPTGESSMPGGDNETGMANNMAVSQEFRRLSAAGISNHGVGSGDRISTPSVPSTWGQFAPILHQVPSNRFRDANAGPSTISQSAADEGSRTGIKGPGILSSINASGGASERNSSGMLPIGNRQKSGTNVLEPESSAPPRLVAVMGKSSRVWSGLAQGGHQGSIVVKDPSNPVQAAELNPEAKREP
ncbi:protein tify 8 [Quercus suber]|uniref:Protein tify 8 n=1 Tax=Quercus suber TaxID=58331 RepID=A0AAW0LJC5_QUESU